MFRKIIKVEKEEDLRVELPKKYLNKHVEVIAFQVADEEIYAVKKRNAKRQLIFLKQ